MATAWTPLANITLSGTQATVTFSSISGSYRDLVLIASDVKSSTNNENMQFRFNTDSGANYNGVWIRTDGSSHTTSSEVNQTQASFSSNVLPNTTSPNIFVMQIMDYSATDKHKTVITRGGNFGSTFPGMSLTISRWASTAAVTTITLKFQSTATYAVGSNFALYGVSA